jgi:hypothetical protein
MRFGPPLGTLSLSKGGYLLEAARPDTLSRRERAGVRGLPINCFNDMVARSKGADSYRGLE